MKLPAIFTWAVVFCLGSGALTGASVLPDENDPGVLERLFSALDPAYPDIEKARAAWFAGDRFRACELLTVYFRDKPLSDAPFLRNVQADNPLDLPATRDILENRFRIQGQSVQAPVRSDGTLDWTYRGPKADKELAWMLNRHFYFFDLVRAYEATGEVIFIEKLDALLSDWVLANPSPRRWTFSESWRALEAARRILDSWVWTFYRLRDEGSFPMEARLLLLSSLPDHAEMLQRYASFWGGNHYLTEKIALAQLAIAFPEFKRSSEWLDHARKAIRRTIFWETYPEGEYKELSTHYQRIVTENLQRYLDLLAHAGYSEEEDALFRRGEAMWDALFGVMRPSGFGPLNNGSDLEYLRSPRLLAMAEALGREDWRHIWTNGREGRAPAGSSSRLFRSSGQAVMRSGWDEDAWWAFFDMGPHGTAHQHDDRLHLSVSAFGEDYLVDAGRYHYRPDRWKRYFTGPRSHNVVLLNRNGTRPPPNEVVKPLRVTWRETSSYILAQAEQSYPQWQGKHRRSVMFAPERYLLVLDEIITAGPAQVEALWHVHPSRMVRKDSDRIRIDGQQGGLTLIPLAAEPLEITEFRGIEKPEPRGWYAAYYNQREAASELVFKRRGTGPTTLAWVLVPSREADAVVIEDFTIGSGRVELTLAVEGVFREKVRLSASGVESLHRLGP